MDNATITELDELRTERRWLRVEEAAHLLGVSRSKTYDLISRGDLRSVQLDGSRRVPARCLADYMDEAEAAAGL